MSDTFDQLKCSKCGELIRMFHGVLIRDEYFEVWVSCMACGYMTNITFLKKDIEIQEEKKEYIG